MSTTRYIALCLDENRRVFILRHPRGFKNLHLCELYKGKHLSRSQHIINKNVITIYFHLRVMFGVCQKCRFINGPQKLYVFIFYSIQCLHFILIEYYFLFRCFVNVPSFYNMARQLSVKYQVSVHPLVSLQVFSLKLRQESNVTTMWTKTMWMPHDRKVTSERRHRGSHFRFSVFHERDTGSCILNFAFQAGM